MKKIQIGEPIVGCLEGYSSSIENLEKYPSSCVFPNSGGYLISKITGEYVWFLNNRLVTTVKALEKLGYKRIGAETEVSKTTKAFETFKFQNREITLAIVYDGDCPKAGYSVKVPEDTSNAELARKIAVGRALSNKTNLLPEHHLPPTYGNNKSILIVLAKQLRRDIEKGKIIIKGIRNPKTKTNE